jgi:hypothetical protein
MVNYNNASNFPTNTDVASGGIDQLAITGLWVTNASYVLLPDKVDGFQATLANDKVKLCWQLYTTDNLKNEVVERSTDGINYLPLLTLPAPKGGPQTATDMHPMPGANYYRLKLVNTDGTVAAYTPVNSIIMATSMAPDLYIYPNPIKNRQFYINAPGLAHQGYNLRLFDIKGKCVFRQSLNDAPAAQRAFRLPNTLAPGIYVVQLADNNGNTVFDGKMAVE